MTLKDELKKQGSWLFKNRSYLPLLLLPLTILGLFTGNFLQNNSLVVYIYNIICFFISFLGFSIRILTIGYVPKRTSGRNTKKQVADSLNTTGIYSIVRHPLYLGNFLMWLGIILFVQSLWLIFIFILMFWIYYERIMFTEEEFLTEKFGKNYIEWANKTPFFFPSFKLWKKSDLPFSFKKVLKQECPGLLGLVSCFTLMHFLKNLICRDQFLISLPWLIIFLFTCLLYLIIRIIKKETKLLKIK